MVASAVGVGSPTLRALIRSGSEWAAHAVLYIPRPRM